MTKIKSQEISILKCSGKVIVSEYAKQQIDYMHLIYPSKEWSGVLIYKLIEGPLLTDSKKDEFVFGVLGLYPMDLGKAAYTEFDYDNCIPEIYDIFEKKGYTLEEIKTGLIHSHHNMTAYFSGTDDRELADNAAKFNYYLSLVVSTDENYAAKLAIPSRVTANEVHSILDSEGKPRSFSLQKERQEIFAIELDVEIEGETNLDEWFVKRLTDLKEESYKKHTYSSREWDYSTKEWDPVKCRWVEKSSSNHYGNNNPKQYTMFGKNSVPETKKKEIEPKIVDNSDIRAFLTELLSEMVGKDYLLLRTAVIDASGIEKDLVFKSNEEIEATFDKNFSVLYIKHFKGKPATEDELTTVLSEAIDEVEEVLKDNEQEISAIEVSGSIVDIVMEGLYNKYASPKEVL